MAVERAPVFSVRSILWICTSWQNWKRFLWRWPPWTCKSRRLISAPISRPPRRPSWSITAMRYWRTRRSSDTSWRISLAGIICSYRIKKWLLSWKTCLAWVSLHQNRKWNRSRNQTVELYVSFSDEREITCVGFVGCRNSSCYCWMRRTRTRIPSPRRWWRIYVRLMSIWVARARASLPATPCAASTANWCRGCNISGSPASILPTLRYRRLWCTCGGTCIICIGSTLFYRAARPIRISLTTTNCNRWGARVDL